MDDMYSEYIDENSVSGVLVNPFLSFVKRLSKLFFLSRPSVWNLCLITYEFTVLFDIFFNSTYVENKRLDAFYVVPY